MLSSVKVVKVEEDVVGEAEEEAREVTVVGRDSAEDSNSAAVRSVEQSKPEWSKFVHLLVMINMSLCV